MSQTRGKIVWVGEYSARQDACHIQPLAKSLQNNIERALRKDTSNDWVLISIGDREGVGRIIEAVREGQERLLRGKK